jgi:glycosyltransferase involved in cell wall biosynthesis
MLERELQPEKWYNFSSRQFDRSPEKLFVLLIFKDKKDNICMRLLVISRYFWPDTAPFASMLPAILKRLADDGHEVTVFTGQPSQNLLKTKPQQPWKEKKDGYQVVRCPLFNESSSNIPMRLLNMLVFMLGTLWHVLSNKKFDILLTTSHPPIFLAGVTRWCAKVTGASFVNYYHDIYPELAHAAGLLKKGFLYRWLLNLDQKNCSQATAVVALSKDMETTLKSRQPNETKNFHIINSFILPSEESTSELPPAFFKTPEKFRILFAGNIGSFQGLDMVIETAKLLENHKDIQFLFVGDGATKSDLINQAEALIGKTLLFLPRQEISIINRIMETADLGLISLTPKIYQMAYPSKTMNYMAQGCPLLVVVEPESELSQFVKEKNIGYVAPSQNAIALKDTILRAYERKGDQTEMRIRTARLAQEFFGEEQAAKAWSNLITEVGSLKHKSVSN